MTRVSIEIAPAYSMISIAGTGQVDVPETPSSRRIATMATCIVVPTRVELDGPTEIVLSDASVDTLGAPAFDGNLETLDGLVVVETAEIDRLLEIQAKSSLVRVRILTNHPSEPSRIEIVVG